METHIKEFLEKIVGTTLLDGKGDDSFSGEYYLENAASSFFTLAARAFAEDGVNRETLKRFLLDSAHEILDEDETPDSSDAARRSIREDVLKFHAEFPPYRPRKKVRLAPDAPAFDQSETQKMASTAIREVVSDLRQNKDVPRKEVYRVLAGNLTRTLRDENVDEKLVRGLKMLLMDLGKDMEDPHMDAYNEKYSLHPKPYVVASND